MFPSMNLSSPVPAVIMQPETMMLPPRQGTIFLVLFTRGRRHTCWIPSESNKFTLDSSDHRTPFPRTMNHSSNLCSWPGCLQQTVCRLFCEPASEEASLWNDGHAKTDLLQCVAYGLSTDKLTFRFCNL